jgi:hypothetical protein
MKLAVIGSRGLKDLVIDPYITEDVTEIVSGGRSVRTLVPWNMRDGTGSR